MVHHRNGGFDHLNHFLHSKHLEQLKMKTANNRFLFCEYPEGDCARLAMYHRFKGRWITTKRTLQANQSLLSSLREGGYVLYAKHAEATLGTDQHNLNFNDCSTQRNLSENGRRQAIVYGDVIRRLHIPVLKPVIASPFCRTVHTAILAFGYESVQVDPFWINIYHLSTHLSSIQQQEILNDLKSHLEEMPPPGENKVIIAHSFPEGVGLGQISDMETVIVKPFGRGNGYQVVGRLSLQDLNELI